MPKGYKEAYSKHDGAAHLGRDGGSKQSTRKPAKPRAGRIGTEAGVAAFDGAARSPDSPPRLQSGRSGTPDALASGKDAGGRDNMKAGGTKQRGAGMSVPKSGSPKFRPEGVHVGDGKSVPKRVAKAPR